MRMLIDEFRMRSSKPYKKFKMWAVSVLKNWLGKLDNFELKKCSIDKDVSFTISKFIPDDNKWHHIALTIDYQIKLQANDLKEEKIEDAFYLNGTKKDKVLYSVDNIL